MTEYILIHRKEVNRGGYTAAAHFMKEKSQSLILSVKPSSFHFDIQKSAASER
jgi:hypothetical protein